MSLTGQGFVTFDPTPQSRAWAVEALRLARDITSDPAMRAANLRHGNTWFVGVDALPNGVDGSLNEVPLRGPWETHLPQHGALHRAQLSVMFPGYPIQDEAETAANHRYRKHRAAAHLDGLHAIGPDRRRFAMEQHAYILGISLDGAGAAPTVCWPGSHLILGEMLKKAIGSQKPNLVDVTEAYQAARAQVFDLIEPVALSGLAGSSFLLHRFMLHGTAPWGDADEAARMNAFFRPAWQGDLADWLTDP